MRYYVRIGRRSAVSMPLWVAVLAYIVWAAVAWTVALAIGLTVVAVIVLYALGMVGQFVVLRWRRRRAHKHGDLG